MHKKKYTLSYYKTGSDDDNFEIFTHLAQRFKKSFNFILVENDNFKEIFPNIGYDLPRFTIFNLFKENNDNNNEKDDKNEDIKRWYSCYYLNCNQS